MFYVVMKDYTYHDAGCFGVFPSLENAVLFIQENWGVIKWFMYDKGLNAKYKDTLWIEAWYFGEQTDLTEEATRLGLVASE